MTWNPPSDAVLAEGKVIKASTHRQIRDLTEALANQDDGAPSITWAAMGIGGTMADGVLNDATDFSTSGWYEGSSLTLTGPKTIGTTSVIQVRGAVDISGQTLTVNNRGATAGDNYLFQFMGFESAADGVNDGDDAGGAGAWGSGSGPGDQGIGRGNDNYIGLLNNGSLNPGKPQVGGNGSNPSGTNGRGGGALVIAVDGDADLSSATINANGSGSGRAGGGGGSVYILVRGNADITGLTVNAQGADGTGNENGGGGLVYIIAETLTGTATINVAAVGGAQAGLGIQQEKTGAQITMAMRLLNIGL